jgi:hypothetical protein
MQALVVIRAAKAAKVEDVQKAVQDVQQTIKLLTAGKIATEIQPLEKLDAAMLAQQEIVWLYGNFHDAGPMPPAILPILKTCRATLIMDDPGLWYDLDYCRSTKNFATNFIINSKDSKKYPTGGTNIVVAMNGPATIRQLLVYNYGYCMGYLDRSTRLEDKSKTPAIRLLIPQINYGSGPGAPEPTKQFIQQWIQAVLKQHYTDLPP